MATADRRLVDLQLSKVNFNSPIMQLEQIFGKSLVFSDCCNSKSNVEQSYSKISTIN